MSLSWIDILFLVTVALLVFNGLKNGFVFSLINLLSIPLGFAAAIWLGPQLTGLLAANGLPSTPLISYIVLFFGTVLVLHIIGNIARSALKGVPLIGFGDALLGAAIGFVEAWLLWLVLLIVLGNFLHGLQDAVTQGSQIIPGANIQVTQLKSWHDFYNETITSSIFAHVNGLFVQQLPNIPRLPQ